MSEQSLPSRDTDVRERIRGFVLETFPLARQNPPGDADPLLESGLVDSVGILELVKVGEARAATLFRSQLSGCQAEDNRQDH